MAQKKQKGKKYSNFVFTLLLFIFILNFNLKLIRFIFAAPETKTATFLFYTFRLNFLSRYANTQFNNVVEIMIRLYEAMLRSKPEIRSQNPTFTFTCFFS
jgi:hypothetical protein